MYETLHFNQRARQRGITQRMIDLTLEYGDVKEDKVKLGKRTIKKLLKHPKKISQNFKQDLLKILDKGGLVVVCGSALITTYNWN